MAITVEEVARWLVTSSLEIHTRKAAVSRFPLPRECHEKDIQRDSLANSCTI